ncbi:MAG: CRISPR-associated protein Csx16 [Azonexus sp.]|jgi:CRISPR-associated protein Csx16|uniref:CRISPR-associated protein Csx16 n=1 Tax=Azonexus sp. TaxID=1872668 RepID=UPI002836EA24|nr:CRISPR-associated protein Csx16 [Azonexus sp.]MDR0776281.1 CRISPR-associated protein Csx16 [Azonexus sp.]
MTTFFVTRHPGALDWARGQGITFDRHITHLDTAEVKAGDTVLGSLPVHLAGQVCQQGARYFNLSLNLPENLRGRELDAQTLKECGALLEEFIVKKG